MSRRSHPWFWPVAVMLFVGVILGLVLHQIGTLQTRADQSSRDRDALARKLTVEQRASQALAKQVRKLGGTPVVTPPAEPETSTSGATVVPGPAGPGPTKAQLETAVSDYCAAGRCAHGPTHAELVTALQQYCATGACQGTPGKDGTNGAPGKGTKGDTGATGPAGPGPTDAQLAAAVSSYCANGACQGPAGKDGADSTVPGPTGPAGSVTPGDYACPTGQSMTAIHVTTDGSMSLDCAVLGVSPSN